MRVTTNALVGPVPRCARRVERVRNSHNRRTNCRGLNTTEGGSATKRYYYGLDRIQIDAGTDSYLLHDAQGSTAALTTTAGALQRTFAYDPYGNVRTDTPSGLTPPTTQLRFGGEYLDAVTGNYYLRARDYDPTTGRFDAVDPLPSEMSNTKLSPYVYADNMPTVLSDPTGMRAQGAGVDCGVGMILGYYDPFFFGAPTSVANKIADLFGGTIPELCSDMGRFAGGIGVSLLPATMLRGGGVTSWGSTSVAQADFWAALRTAELRGEIPAGSASRITMGAGVVRGPAGSELKIISTSEARGYLRSGVTIHGDEIFISGAGHAEADIIRWANALGLDVISVGATRPICPQCAGGLTLAGASPATPLKGSK